MREVLLATTLLAALAALTACDAGQTGEEFPLPCDEQRREVPWSDDSVGFSGNDVIEALAEVEATLTRADTSTTALWVRVDVTAGVVERVERSPTPSSEDGDCPDALAVPMLLSLDGDDGLWVSGQAELLANAADSGSAWMEVPASQTSGLALDVAASITVQAVWQEGVTSGSLFEGGPEEEQPLATWGP